MSTLQEEIDRLNRRIHTLQVQLEVARNVTKARVDAVYRLEDK